MVLGLGNLTALRRLQLVGTQVTGARLSHLTCLGSLKVLVLTSDQNSPCHATSRFSSAGMVHMGKLTSLAALDIAYGHMAQMLLSSASPCTHGTPPPKAPLLLISAPLFTHHYCFFLPLPLFHPSTCPSLCPSSSSSARPLHLLLTQPPCLCQSERVRLEGAWIGGPTSTAISGTPAPASDCSDACYSNSSDTERATARVHPTPQSSLQLLLLLLLLLLVETAGAAATVAASASASSTPPPLGCCCCCLKPRQCQHCHQCRHHRHNHKSHHLHPHHQHRHYYPQHYHCSSCYLGAPSQPQCNRLNGKPLQTPLSLPWHIDSTRGDGGRCNGVGVIGGSAVGGGAVGGGTVSVSLIYTPLSPSANPLSQARMPSLRGPVVAPTRPRSRPYAAPSPPLAATSPFPAPSGPVAAPSEQPSRRPAQQLSRRVAQQPSRPWSSRHCSSRPWSSCPWSSRHCSSRPCSSRHCSSRPWSSRHYSSRPRSSHHCSSTPWSSRLWSSRPYNCRPWSSHPCSCRGALALQWLRPRRCRCRTPALLATGEHCPARTAFTAALTAAALSTATAAPGVARCSSSVARVSPSPPNSFVHGTLVGVVGVAVVGVVL
ncbi:unnamed protein product, partial [Closterium sp. NIES-54]